MSLTCIIIVAFASAILTYFLSKISTKVKKSFVVLASLILILIIALLYGKNLEEYYFNFLGFQLIFRINMLSWLFAIAVTVLGSLSIIFSLEYMKEKENTSFYYAMMLLVNAAMIGVVLSGDMVSFFIFWEIMSWSTFLLISYKKGAALAAGMKYIIFSIIGSMAMLIGILSLYSKYSTLNIAELSALIPFASSSYLIFILIIFGIAFAIKNAVVPFHTWLPDAYTESSSPFTAVISGMLTRMGIYGFLLVIYVFLGAAHTFNQDTGIKTFNTILAWLGAISIVIPTFIALLQDDAKKLLAWSSIGQGGYMIVGIAFGTSLGLAGGIFHTINHAIYIVLLFLSVGAVEYRCRGNRDLKSMGGLIKKMPVAFLGGLLGISGLIGVPLTNGFVSKWLIYKTLILDGAPFLAFAALLGTWGTILAVYKFLHNLFMGQMPEKYENVKTAPVSMQIPIIILSSIILIFGILPEIPLTAINSIVTSFGFESLNVSLTGIISQTGMLNTINIFAATLILALLITFIFKLSHKSTKVSQYDNYAAGTTVPKGKYSYNSSFYNPFDRFLNSFLKDYIDIFYTNIANLIKNICNSVRKIYTGYVGSYVMYIILFLSLLVFVQLSWGVF